MTQRRRIAAAVAAGLVTAAAVVAVSAFRGDLAEAAARAAQGSAMLTTACGPIEVQQAGAGLPLLMVHGSGGGHDQGMAFARPLAEMGMHVIAVSRFGYLRTPRPVDASPEAQADAHVCVLDSLGLTQAAVLGASAGAPSALQMAIRHPQRVSALVLVVPITPPVADVMAGASAAASAVVSASAPRPAPAPPPVSDSHDAWLLRLLGSDALVWATLHLAADRFFAHVLATPPALLHTASVAEHARGVAMAWRVLPVSLRVAGLVDDTRLGKSLRPYPLASVRAPTLVISARDDGFGTFDGGRRVAERIAGARFLGYERGGHLLIGHGDDVLAAVFDWIHRRPRPSVSTTGG